MDYPKIVLKTSPIVDVVCIYLTQKHLCLTFCPDLRNINSTQVAR